MNHIAFKRPAAGEERFKYNNPKGIPKPGPGVLSLGGMLVFSSLHVGEVDESIQGQYCGSCRTLTICNALRRIVLVKHSQSGTTRIFRMH